MWGRLSKTRNQDEAAAFLGDSEILSIKHAPGEPIPALGKRPEDRLKVSTSVATDDSGNILKHDVFRMQGPDSFHDFEE